jgi:hypothetical protein
MKKVMEKIKKGEIKMRPKLYFVLGSLVLGVGLAAALGLAAFFINLVFFRLRMQGPLGYLRFGPMGRRMFLEIFPWRLLLVALVGVLGGIWLLKKYGEGYKKSLAAVLLMVLAMALALGWLADRAGINERLKQLPRTGGIYRMRFVAEKWLVGEVTEVGEQQLKVMTPAGEDLTVKWDETTRLLTGADFKVGDKIQVLGKKQDGEFKAEAISRGGLRWDGLERRPGPGMDYRRGMGGDVRGRLW